MGSHESSIVKISALSHYYLKKLKVKNPKKKNVFPRRVGPNRNALSFLTELWLAEQAKKYEYEVRILNT